MKDEARKEKHRRIGRKPWRIRDERKVSGGSLVWVLDAEGHGLFASKPTWARIAVKAVNEQKG